MAKRSSPSRKKQEIEQVRWKQSGNMYRKLVICGKETSCQLVVRENLRMDSKQQKQTKMVCIRLTYRSRASKKR